MWESNIFFFLNHKQNHFGKNRCDKQIIYCSSTNKLLFPATIIVGRGLRDKIAFHKCYKSRTCQWTNTHSHTPLTCCVQHSSHVIRHNGFSGVKGHSGVDRNALIPDTADDQATLHILNLTGGHRTRTITRPLKQHTETTHLSQDILKYRNGRTRKYCLIYKEHMSEDEQSNISRTGQQIDYSWNIHEYSFKMDYVHM